MAISENAEEMVSALLTVLRKKDKLSPECCVQQFLLWMLPSFVVFVEIVLSFRLTRIYFWSPSKNWMGTM